MKFFLAVLMVILVGAACPKGVIAAPPKPKAAGPAPAALVEAIKRDFYRLPYPARIRAHTSLFLKAPRHKSSAWEGALWVYAPQTVTFEAVDELAHTLFYLRYNQEQGWLLQAGETEEVIKLPFTGRDLVAFVSGRPPNLPADPMLGALKGSAAAEAGEDAPAILMGNGAIWTFAPDRRPLSYRSPAPRAYIVEWKGWQASGRYLYPREVHIRDVKGRYEIRLVMYSADVM